MGLPTSSIMACILSRTKERSLPAEGGKASLRSGLEKAPAGGRRGRGNEEGYRSWVSLMRMTKRPPASLKMVTWSPTTW